MELACRSTQGYHDVCVLKLASFGVRKDKAFWYTFLWHPFVFLTQRGIKTYRVSKENILEI